MLSPSRRHHACALFDSPPCPSGSPDGPVQEISPPTGRDSDSEELGEAGSFLTVPLESPLVSPQRQSRTKRRCLQPETSGDAVREANNGFSTPVRSSDDVRLETLLATTVQCPSPLRRSLCPLRENTPFEITPWMSCGTAGYAKEIHRVVRDGFTHVINMCPTQMAIPRESYSQHGIKLTVIDAHDTQDYPLLTRHFHECFRVTENARQERGKVLLHCLKAVNRSVAMAVALQLSTEGASLQDAVRRVTLLRSPVLQNSDFRRQLVHFSCNMQTYFGTPVLSPSPECNERRRPPESPPRGQRLFTTSPHAVETP
eukprot:TRINITY_DN2606_c0_g1_i2.p1 TRINITY_DN2606_c0_g1~~TRINITY_DN2606_c0_g1_i2.p1  ORF type:complete len:326 (+),score=57.55 TRINITY_DN2606_c0_g1_i2:39-980(+)